MASIAITLVITAIMVALTPGMLISVPPGPNKLWLFGGQVTWTNMLVHAALFAIIIYYFV